MPALVTEAVMAKLKGSAPFGRAAECGGVNSTARALGCVSCGIRKWVAGGRGRAYSLG